MMRNLMLALAVFGLLLGAGPAMAWPPPPPDDGGGGHHAPEIDPSMVTGALAVLAGGLIVIRSVRRRK
ncbi:MAG: hypothetical protein WBO69_08505 [Thermoanaerobaculia bacterium]